MSDLDDESYDPPDKEMPTNARSPLDFAALSIGTCGVGYIPIAPGTFGSLVGIVIYLLAAWAEADLAIYLADTGWRLARIMAWFNALNLLLFLLFCILAIWAAGRAVKVFRDKDPQKVVVDEVIGQLLVFFFVPFGLGWQFVLAGFLLFRLFDIWKPYPIDSLQGLPAGIGVCADDILAGCYGGVCLSIIYAISLGV